MDRHLQVECDWLTPFSGRPCIDGTVKIILEPHPRWINENVNTLGLESPASPRITTDEFNRRYHVDE
jgi:hypothetical protein